MEIKAKIICDSISSTTNVRLTTFEVEYPRIIHAEVMTHRVFSRNSASSRAIPFDKMMNQLTGRPIRFGEANSGMQDKGVSYNEQVKGHPEDGPCFGDPDNYYSPSEAWNLAKIDAVFWSQAFKDAGYHKQVYNRLTEPFQMMKVLITATEWDNFFWLRDDGAADPTLHALAKVMKAEYEKGVPKLLQPGQWHVPYVDTFVDDETEEFVGYCISDENGNVVMLQLEDAIKVSAARCAAVSYRNEDYGLEKCLQVHERLVGDERKHASAMEHQATPMREEYNGYFNIPDDSVNCVKSIYTWEKGITHCDRNHYLWSGNLREWIQYRQLIPGQNKSKY